MINLVIDILKANSTLTNLVDANNIYPLIQLQGGTIPSVVVQLTNTDPNDTQDKVSTYDNNSVEITSMAISPAAAWGISEAVRAALDGYTGGLIAQVRFVTQATDIFESTEVFSVTQGYSVHLKRDGATLPTAIAGLGEFNLDDISDVDASNPSDDQVLTYDAASGTWGPEDASTVAGLDDLTDVTITTPANNQALVYNEAAGEWRNDQLSLTQLEGIDSELGNAIDRQALVFDESSNQWIADGVGQVVIPVRNPSRDTPIAVGTVLKATGAQGDRILVAPFNADLDDPRYLVGIASEELGATAETKDGHAQVYGELRNIDTDAYEVGDVLYPDSTGALATTENQYPIAIVLRKQQNTGRIFIRTWTPGRSRYDADVEALRQEMDSSLANADIELYFSAQADGYGLVESPGSDSVVNNTPAEDYQVERAIYYNNTGLASYVSDSSWSTLETNVESYAATKARVEDYIRGGTYGKLPCTFAIVRTEEAVRTGLLADYPGAAAAYSLRLLDTDYTGSAIRVRRASDNAEQDIGFDGNGDLDTTALATFCSGTDGFVKVWYDQANSNDAQTTVTVWQPKIYDSLNGVTKDAGSNSAIEYGLTDDFNLTLQTPITPLDAFIVAEKQSDSFATLIFAGANNTLYAYSTNSVVGLAGTSSFTVAINQPNARHLYNFEFDAGTASIRIDGVTEGSNQKPDPNAGALYIGNDSSGGAGDSWTGYISEVIIYDSLQNANRTGIESNINTYYSIYP